MSFVIQGLPADTFRNLFDKSDEELAALNARRYVADEKPGYPCRVSLQDAEVGETLILATYDHQATGPYRARGPVFVRQSAGPAEFPVDDVPEMIASRALSLRAYDEQASLQRAEVIEGRNLAPAVGEWFGDPAIAYIHAHAARPGCFLCSIHRVDNQ